MCPRPGPRPDCPSVPPRESSQFRSQCPLERNEHPAGTSAKGSEPVGKPPTWEAEAAFPPGTRRSPPRPRPRTAALRPLGGAALQRASRRRERTAGPSDRQIEPEPQDSGDWRAALAAKVRSLNLVGVGSVAAAELWCGRQRAGEGGAATRVAADRDLETRRLQAGPRGRAEHQVARAQTSSGRHARSREQQVLQGEKSYRCPERLQLSTDKVQAPFLKFGCTLKSLGDYFSKV